MGTLKSILIAVIVYIVTGRLLDALVTGTSTGDTLIVQIVPIVLALVTVWVAIKAIGD
jgi:hypothetical protein